MGMLRAAWFSRTKLSARIPEKVVGLGCAGWSVAVERGNFKKLRLYR